MVCCLTTTGCGMVFARPFQIRARGREARGYLCREGAAYTSAVEKTVWCIQGFLSCCGNVRQDERFIHRDLDCMMHQSSCVSLQ